MSEATLEPDPEADSRDDDLLEEQEEQGYGEEEGEREESLPPE